jgi:hypothetical protein
MTTPIYTPQTWVNGEAGNTPITDTALNHIEAGIHDASVTANAAAALLPPAGTDTLSLLNSFVAPFSAVQGYREPTGPELTNALTGLGRLFASTAEATTLLNPLGFTIVTGTEATSKRPFALAYSAAPTDQRGWGFYLFDLSAPIDLVIEAPHPISEQYSEVLAWNHWVKRPGALLMVAGAHASAASGLADVALQTNNVFHQMAANYATRKIAQVQWHGYADATAPGLNQVVSSGAAYVGAAVKRVSTELAAAGFAVGNAWDSSGSGTSLTAVTNVQGIDAAAKQSTFIVVDNSNLVRTDTSNRARAVSAVVAAEVNRLANADGGLPGRVGTDFPQSIGTANTVGTSVYFARADHIHKERQATLDRITNLESTNVPSPIDYGYLTWVTDPAEISGLVTPTAGVLYLVRVPLRQAVATPFTNLHLGVGVAGSGLTAGQCFVALFNATSGARLAVSADISGGLAVGETTHALASPPTITGPVYVYLGVLLNGTTMPQLARGGPSISGLGNVKTTASSKRFAQYGTGQTTMPSSITLSSMVNTANAPWFGVS